MNSLDVTRINIYAPYKVWSNGEIYRFETDNGIKTPGGDHVPLTRPGYPETFRRAIVRETGTRYLVPQETK